MSSRYTKLGSTGGAGGGTINGVGYLRYDAVSGTQSGEIGTTLIAPSIWQITQTSTIYYIDPRDGSGNSNDMTIIIPDASLTNANETITFRKPNLAGDLGTITLSSVGGQNIGPRPTYTFNHPSDQVQLVSNEFEFGAGTYKWRQTYDSRQPENTIYVDVNGYNGYSSIQDAIDSIDDASSSSNIYTIAVYSGVYNENITLKDGVSLKGLGAVPWGVEIKPNSGPALTWADNSSYSHVNNVQLIGPSAIGPGDTIVSVANGTHVLRDVVLEWITPGPFTSTEIVMLSASGDSVVNIDRCNGYYIQGGYTVPGNNKQRIFKSTNQSRVEMNNSKFTLTIADSGDSIYFLKDESTNTENKFWKNNSIDITLTDSDFAGNCKLIEAAGGTDTIHFQSNNILLSALPAPSAVNWATMYASYEGTGDIISSVGNEIKIEGFGRNYFAILDATATLVSHFDDSTAGTRLSGEGQFDHVYTAERGDLDVSGDVLIESTLTLPLLTGDNTIVTTDTNGTLQDTTMSITEGPSGGSVINVIEHASDPVIGSLVTGDLWITDSPATSGKLFKYFDGIDIYSVELSKE